MMPRGILILAGAACMALAGTSWGQRPSSWRVYKAADGLPQSECVSVTVSPLGRVLAKHFDPPSISELDGYSIKVYPLPEISRGRAYRSPSGPIWTMMPGGLLEFKAHAWVPHLLPEAVSSHIGAPFYPIKQGSVIFLLPDQLLELNEVTPDQPVVDVLRTAAQTQIGSFTQLAPSHDGGLWVSGTRGLAKLPGPLRNLKPQTPWQEFIPPSALQAGQLQEPHEDADGGVTLAAESTQTHEKLIAYFDGLQWTTWAAGTGRVRQAWRGPDKTFWAFTSSSLFQGEGNRSEMVEDEDVSAVQYFDVASEPNGVFWLATSEGLFRCAPLTWRSPPGAQSIHALAHGLAGDADGRLWFLSGGGLCLLHNEQLHEYPLPPGVARNTTAGTLFSLKNGALVLVVPEDPGSDKTRGDLLFQFDPDSGQFRSVEPVDPARERHCLGMLADDSLCIQSLQRGTGESSYRLDKYDGAAFRPLTEPAPDLLLGPVLNTAFATHSSDVWLGGEIGTAWFHDRKWRFFASNDRTCPIGARCFVEESNGRIVCATWDQVWEFDGQSWRMLRGGFDRIYGVVRTHDGSIWVASNSGLRRFFQDAWIDNGVEEGLPSPAVREVYEDPGGRLWVGTLRGLSLYYPEADPDPPRTTVQSPANQEETEVPQGGTLTLRFGGLDKWKYTPRERLLYAYRLDEQDWSPFADVNGISFNDLPAGKHYFQVRAMDRNGNIERKPAQLEFTVVLPWYQETRLVLISSAGLAAAMFFAALAFNRHRRLVRSYAEVEKKVTERTRELEIANRELLHSQKMNALGTLAAGIAHDFNNILSIVKGSAQIIEDNLDNPRKVRTRVDRIKTVVEQGAAIVRAMLGFSRDSGQQIQRCEINSVAQDTIKMLGDRFLREVQVIFEPEADLPPIMGAKDFIQQILLNFIFNAAEAATQRRQIILATRRIDALPAGLVLTPASSLAYVSVSVRDFGCGISPEVLPRIFEPFFTTKALSTRRGTGLGLSMAYELAGRMQAGLAVESAVDQGSTFTLILPAPPLPAADAPESPQTAKTPSRL